MKAIVHFTYPDGSEDRFHFEGTPEKIRETAEKEILARGCDPSLAWTLFGKYNTLASPGLQEDRADYIPHFYFFTFLPRMICDRIRDARIKAQLSLREAVEKSVEIDQEKKGLSLSTLARLETRDGKKPIHPRTARILSAIYPIEYDALYH